MPEAEARYYQSRVEGGSVLLTVATPHRAREAWEIMHQDGAEDLRAKGFSAYPDDETRAGGAEPPDDAVDGPVVPPDGQSNAQPGPLQPDRQTDTQPGLVPPAGPPQSAHVPPEAAHDVEEGGFDAPQHPMLDKDIIAADSGHAGQPERPPE